MYKRMLLLIGYYGKRHKVREYKLLHGLYNMGDAE